MANRYMRAAGGNWSTAGNWESTNGGGESVAAPTSSDDVFIPSGRGNVTIDTTTCAAKTLDCTGYTGTLAMGTGRLSVSGNITLASGMSFSGTGDLRVLTAGTLTSAGRTIPLLTFNMTGSEALADALNTTTLTNLGAAITFTGTSSISTVNLLCSYGITWPAGQRLNVSGSMALRSTVTVVQQTMKSGTTSSVAYLAYTGVAADIYSVAMIFTDIDFSTYSTPVTNLDNWYGGTLTRTTGITNRTSADIGGGGSVDYPDPSRIGA